MSGQLKVEGKKVVVNYTVDYKLDKDADGKVSLTAKNTSEIEIDIPELLGEIAKKDLSILEAFMASIKVEKGL
jgi:hypothetical protein